ncbi:MAG: hypothetical protein WBD50_05485 [Candidatus Rhabdochlamydia sp.]
MEKIHTVTQSINSFIRPMGLSLCNQQQIRARVALIALAVLNLPIAAKAFLGSNEAFSDCVQGRAQFNTTAYGYCIRDYMTNQKTKIEF